MITEEDKSLAKQLWDYHHVNHTPEKVDTRSTRKSPGEL